MADLATEGPMQRERTTTSFQRKVPDGGGGRLAVLPGTRPSVRHGQLLLSSGVPSLDSVLGGGLAIGTLLLIEEDVYGVYSNLLFKNFLAEGVVCGHNLFIASDKEEPDIILKELPCPLPNLSDKEMGEVITVKSTQDSQESMRIAWRYQNKPKQEVTHIPFSKFGHYFDLSKTMAPELIQNIKWDGFFFPGEAGLDSEEKSCKKACVYTRLLHSIQKVICQQGYNDSTFQKKQRNVLRIGIQSLGSVLWGDDICCTENPENLHSLTRFMYALRGLLRTSLSACIITVPTHLIQNKAITERVIHLSDTVIGLESFIGSERETNPLYKDNHAIAFASRLVRHSEPHKQTGSGSLRQIAEHRM
ncbi:elongator complex protein 4 isoform X3 [Erythrolamprus reginae]|uniref:elongator complex protein 4 isoform X3 n=1 Tax=Erythrolamprus reginae TaxID=121349 RepID=UPI00396CBEE2